MSKRKLTISKDELMSEEWHESMYQLKEEVIMKLFERQYVKMLMKTTLI